MKSARTAVEIEIEITSCLTASERKLPPQGYSGISIFLSFRILIVSKFLLEILKIITILMETAQNPDWCGAFGVAVC